MTWVGRRPLAAAMLLVAVVATAAAAPGTFVRATYGAHTTADEPHYLLTAISLAEDGDLDVADELAAERYRPFHEIEPLQQAAPQPDGRMLVPHDPLLPALLVVPWLLGGWVATKLAMAVLAGALAAVTLWTAVRHFGARVWPAAATIGVLMASAPLAVYGTQIYPELPAALAVVVAVAATTARPSLRADLVVLAAVVALPWLAVKYVPVAGAVAVVHLVGGWRAGRRRQVGALLAGFVATAAAYLWVHIALYGGATVYAAGDFFRSQGGQLSVLGTDPSYLGRARRIVGLFVGQDFGIAAWQPAWLLTIGGVAALARGRPPAWLLLAAPAVVGWLTATFVALTMQGYWFPGRQVVVVLPLLAIALARWASRDARVLTATVVAGVAGVVTWVWLLAEGLAGDLTWVVDFATTSGPVYRTWQAVLPDYLTVTASTWVLHGVWIVAAVALVVAGWRSTAGGPERVSVRAG